MSRDVTRRAFLASAGKAAVGAGILASALPAPAIGRALGSPADRINVGLIGCGGQGRGVMGGFMGQQEVEVVAVCDVEEGHAREAARQVEKKYGQAPKVFKDYRKLLEMNEVNAVIVGTPDHWHALPTINACEAGKDVYVEKPLSMHNTTVACHLTNLAYQAGRGIKWDPVKEVPIGDSEAMELGAYRREYRSPWKLPLYERGEA